MMAAPVIAHGLAHTQFVGTPAGVVKRRFGRVGLPIVVTTHDYLLLCMHKPRHRYLHIEGGQSRRSLPPAMNRKSIAPHPWPKTRQVVHHLLRPVRRELVMPLVGSIARLPTLKMRSDIRELVIDVKRVGNGEIQANKRSARNTSLGDDIEGKKGTNS